MQKQFHLHKRDVLYNASLSNPISVNLLATISKDPIVAASRKLHSRCKLDAVLGLIQPQTAPHHLQSVADLAS